MRAFRFLLLGVFAFALMATGAFAEHYQANCPLTYVGATDPASPFFLSPNGSFRNGSLVYILRGGTLTTQNITELGNVEVVREDYISSMANHDEEGGVTYSAGFMFVSGEEGLEIFDLRNVRAGGSAPALISRTKIPHYRRITVQGNILAAIFPANDLPCQANGTTRCRNQIDIYNITNLAAPAKMSSIIADHRYIGFNDIKFAAGYLYATGFGGTFAFDVTTDPTVPRQVFAQSTIGSFLTTNGTSVIGIGQETLVGVYVISPAPRLAYFAVFTLPSIWDRQDDLMFHPEAYIDDMRLITLIDEKNPLTGKPGRTLAFDAFDFTVPIYQGADDRIYENVSFTFPDELKFHPLLVGSFVHVIGEVSGTQKWGACDQMAGYVNFDFLQALPCGGAELYGAVTSKHKMTSVELYIDSRSLGFASLGEERYDVDNASGPIRSFSINVGLDDELRGEHLLRAVGTDIFGNRRQFWTKEVYFPGPGGNCTHRKRGARR
ncbi:MAG: hypothetical protein ACSLFQ_02800 [Thermoanaerobaculia bacterium]